MTKYLCSVGVKYGRGATMMVEQMIVLAKDAKDAYQQAMAKCYRGEFICDVELV